MIHRIINQNDNHIYEEVIRDEIDHAVEHDLTYTYFDGKRIDIKKTKYVDGERTTHVVIEGI